MLTVKLSGGLGNQFFQYAVANAINRNSQPIAIVYQSKTNAAHAERNMSISKFHIPENTIYSSNLQEIEHSFTIRLAMKIGSIVNMICQNDEDGLQHLIKLGFKVSNSLGYCNQDKRRYFWPKYKKNLYLTGMWHSPIYADKDYDNICKYYRLKDEYITSELKSRIDEIASAESVCVHIRHGDYLSAQGFNVLTPEYYHKSINLLREKSNSPKFFIFSDDIEWCENNITGEDVVYMDNGFEDYQDFELMRNCKHFIISNSTFSWWAAYLGREKKKIVITPSIWFDNNPKKHMNLSDWIEMDE